VSDQEAYTINLEEKFGALELISLPALLEQCTEPWFNQTLCRVNDCVIRLGIIRGEFHWHRHVQEDEFFYVVEGGLLIDLQDRTVELGPRQVLVPRGVMQRTRAPQRTVLLMVEKSTIRPTGD
jgi:mannose-6-phosphate isomerase-like protein (cupin superfamily)